MLLASHTLYYNCVVTNQSTPRAFHKRFNLEVGADTAKRRFVNRAANMVFDHLYETLASGHSSTLYYAAKRAVATRLGVRYQQSKKIEFYVGTYESCLQALEAVYQALEGSSLQMDVSNRIGRIVRDSEVDLGVDWQPPLFVRTGAEFLDESLVNESLHWLSEPKYKTAYDPFEKGLSHYLEAEKKPHVLADVVTDMYEAVEALARIITGKNKDLSGNQQSFIKAIRASDYYKGLLRDYISYANQYRHAVRLGQPRPTLSEPEVESFVYLTGLFIRLAIRQTQPST